ncbi:DUF6119 family protein [Streptomyces sp. M-16]|uniref:DUF6119 family protein n=1 Tax=Streptomyces sp. M-16 TaxID=3233040 RepID=UPI003F962DE8
MRRDEEGADLVSALVKAHKWIAAEISLGSSRYFHHEGRWFEFGDQHLEGMAGSRHPADDSGRSRLPAWTSEFKTEGVYNLEAAKHGYLWLNRQLIRTPSIQTVLRRLTSWPRSAP